jgi:hypothetical protein
MIRVLVHLAVPDATRAIAATMTGLSGLITEHSVELSAVAGGPSAVWDAQQGYAGIWWGASQHLETAIAQTMMTSGYMLGTESWFAARFETDGTLIDHNLPTPPADASFAAFLTAAGLAMVPGEPFP